MSNWLNPTYKIVEGKSKMLPEYNQWYDMTKRSRSKCTKTLKPSYSDVNCIDDWMSYDVWLDWARCQQGFLMRDEGGHIFHLDKDILGNGKLYAPENCCFVPKDINISLVKVYRGFQVMPNGNYRVVGTKTLEGGKRYSLGCYSSHEEAVGVLRNFNIQNLKELCEYYKDDLDPVVYSKLKEYRFEYIV